MSECIYEIINFPKYHWKNLIDFCPARLFRLSMLCTHLSRVVLRIIKTNHMYLVYKIFQGRNLSNFFGDSFENRWFNKYILTLSGLLVEEQWTQMISEILILCKDLWKLDGTLQIAQDLLGRTQMPFKAVKDSKWCVFFSITVFPRIVSALE